MTEYGPAAQSRQDSQRMAAFESQARSLGQPGFIQRADVREGPKLMIRGRGLKLPGNFSKPVSQFLVIIPAPGVSGNSPFGYRGAAGIDIITSVITQGCYQYRPAAFDDSVRPIF